MSIVCAHGVYSLYTHCKCSPLIATAGYGAYSLLCSATTVNSHTNSTFLYQNFTIVNVVIHNNLLHTAAINDAFIMV